VSMFFYRTPPIWQSNNKKGLLGGKIHGNEHIIVEEILSFTLDFISFSRAIPQHFSLCLPQHS